MEKESLAKILSTTKNNGSADSLKQITNNPTGESKNDDGTPEKARSSKDMETPNAASDASNECPSGSVDVGVSVGQSSSSKKTGKDSEEFCL